MKLVDAIDSYLKSEVTTNQETTRSIVGLCDGVWFSYGVYGLHVGRKYVFVDEGRGDFPCSYIHCVID